MSNLSAFKTQVTIFLQDLEKSAPKKRHFIRAKKDIILGAWKINPKLVVQQFYDAVLPYKDHVKEKNEDFFVKDFDVKENVANQDFLHVLDFKKIWQEDLSDKSKESFWKYIQVLFVLSRRICGSS